MEAGPEKWICVQLGAREHYAIPRALHRTGRLEVLFTEIWAGPLLRGMARFFPVRLLKAIAGRWHADLEFFKRGSNNPFRYLIPTKAEWAEGKAQKQECKNQKVKIISWNWQSLCRDLQKKIESNKQQAQIPPPQDSQGIIHARFIRDGQWFSGRARDWLVASRREMRGRIVFSYDTTALELFRWAKERGAICVLGQMDPGRVELELVCEEEKRWPGWAGTLETRDLKPGIGNGRLEEYCRRREEEWRLADRIIVNSLWSLEALLKQGVPFEKLAVLPLSYEAGSQKVKDVRGKVETGRLHFNAESPLHVLFLGQVILRKGIQYLVEAAKLLKEQPVHFDVVGPIGISADAVKSIPSNMTFHGLVNRDRAVEWYRKADLFVLPTLSDGFALTQLEAMMHGLPVIATPNCGSVVTNGVDGFLVPVRDGEALAVVLRRYLNDPAMLREHSRNAQEKAKEFSISRLAEGLGNLQHGLHAVVAVGNQCQETNGASQNF